MGEKEKIVVKVGDKRKCVQIADSMGFEVEVSTFSGEKVVG